MNDYELLAVIVICLLAATAYKKSSQNRVLKKLFAYKQMHKTEEFMNYIDSSVSKMSFSSSTIIIMKLNYFIDSGMKQEAIEYYKSIKKHKMSDKDRIAVYSKMFGFALENKDKENALVFSEKLEKVLRDKKDKKSKALLHEINQLSAIYIDHETTLIPDLLEELSGSDDQQVRSVLCFRLAKLYHYDHDETRAKEYVGKAIDYSAIRQERIKLKLIAEDLSTLD